MWTTRRPRRSGARYHGPSAYTATSRSRSLSAAANNSSAVPPSKTLSREITHTSRTLARIPPGVVAEELLALELEDLQLSNYGLELTGFETEEIDRLIESLGNEPEGLAGPTTRHQTPRAAKAAQSNWASLSLSGPACNRW